MHVEISPKTRRKVLKVVKIKDANYVCKDEGNESVSQSVVRGVCDCKTMRNI